MRGTGEEIAKRAVVLGTRGEFLRECDLLLNDTIVKPERKLARDLKKQRGSSERLETVGYKLDLSAQFEERGWRAIVTDGGAARFMGKRSWE